MTGMTFIGVFIGMGLVSLMQFLYRSTWIWIGGIVLLAISFMCFGQALKGEFGDVALGIAGVTLFGAAVGTPVRLLQTTIQDGPMAFRHRVLIALGGVVLAAVIVGALLWFGFAI